MEPAYNQWDTFPIHLSTHEIANPLRIISDFYSDDSLSGHLERLTQWRDFVLRDDYYKDIKGSPAGLLHFYKLNIRLIEAASLLTKAFPCEFGIELIQQNIYPELAAILSRLSEAQRLDLYAVLSGFFAAYSLHEYRVQLSEWLEHGLSKKGAEEFITSIDLVTVYENLQRLYAAAWLICQHLPETLFVNDNDNTTLPLSDKPFPGVAVYQLETGIPEHLVEPIGKVVAVIKHQVPSVQVIYYSGVAPAIPELLYFLVFTSDNEMQHAHSLASNIKDSCKEIIPVHATVLQVAKLFDGVAFGNRFFRRAITLPVLYLSGDTLLPSPGQSKSVSVNEKTLFNWERWFIQGKDFFSGAEFYINRRSFGAALFSLHQCAESLLTAIIKAVLDYNIGGHNLTKLLEMTQMFTPDIANLFELGDEEKAKQFDMLKQAYVNVRYRDNYESDENHIADLHLTIQQLIIIVEKVYQKHLLLNNL